MSSVNPYAAPAATVEDVSANPEAEAVRREHISTEASIKAVGFLYYLGGVLLIIGALVGIAGAPGAQGANALISLLLVAIGVGELLAGWGVRAFRSWGRIVGCILSVLGLFAFPIGTIINAYILYLFLSKKGRRIFAPDYPQIIAATPDVKYKTSIIVWIFLALIVGLILFGIFSAFIGR